MCATRAKNSVLRAKLTRGCGAHAGGPKSSLVLTAWLLLLLVVAGLVRVPALLPLSVLLLPAAAFPMLLLLLTVPLFAPKVRVPLGLPVPGSTCVPCCSGLLRGMPLFTALL